MKADVFAQCIYSLVFARFAIHRVYDPRSRFYCRIYLGEGLPFNYSDVIFPLNSNYGCIKGFVNIVLIKISFCGGGLNEK